LLHVIDANQPTWEEQRIVVEQVLDELGVGDRPRLLVFNKIDLLAEEDQLALQERIGRLVKNAVFVSALQEGGLEPLRRALGSAVRARRPLTEIRFSAGDGKLLAEIHRSGEVVDQRTDGDQLIIRARVDEALAGRLRRAGAEVTGGIATPI
jgi:GTP-binding protein HflX